MKEKINVAVIGCGSIANSAHIPAYIASPVAEIKYFCDIIPERADAAVEKYGCGKAVYDYHEILDDPELDAVSVCTHNDMHSVIMADGCFTITNDNGDILDNITVSSFAKSPRAGFRKIKKAIG